MSDAELDPQRLVDLGLDAEGLSQLDFRLLELDDDGEVSYSDEETNRSLSILKGCIWWASEVLLDELFEALGNKQRRETDLGVLDQLPPHFHHRIDEMFAKKFLVAAIDQLSGIAGTWVQPKCVAQELVVHLLMEEVEVVADMFEVALPAGWRSAIVDVLMWEDDDYLYLWEPEHDGIWSQPEIPGMANMDFSAWFHPFDSTRDRLPTYLWPEARTEP